MKKYTIVIADDHTLFRRGLHMLLANVELTGEVHEAANGAELLELLDKHSVDIVLMDIDMPVMDGVEATVRALEKHPDLNIIALSMYGDEQYYYKMINAGVKGFLLKDSDISEVIQAISSVAEGRSYFSSDILVSLVKNPDLARSKSEELTERETEVLHHICKGLSNVEIAEVLYVNKRTIDKHRENLLSKTQSKNTASLIMWAIRNKRISE